MAPTSRATTTRPWSTWAASGTPLDATTASYVVLEGVADSLEPAPFGIQFVRVPFDTEAEIAVAMSSGMPEAHAYAVELRTGLYRGYQEG
jgi:hypothetical protein